MERPFDHRLALSEKQRQEAIQPTRHLPVRFLLGIPPPNVYTAPNTWTLDLSSSQQRVRSRNTSDDQVVDREL